MTVDPTPDRAAERCPRCLFAGRYYMIDLGLDACDCTEAQKTLWRVEHAENRPAERLLWRPTDPRNEATRS